MAYEYYFCGGGTVAMEGIDVLVGLPVRPKCSFSGPRRAWQMLPKRTLLGSNRGESAVTEVASLMAQVEQLRCAAVAARQEGDETVAEKKFRAALELAEAAVHKLADGPIESSRLDILLTTAQLALEGGNAAAARRLVDRAKALEPAIADANEWNQVQDITSWPDAWLIAAVRRDPPDAIALDALAERHWKRLFGRCQLLAVNRERANDLAQEAWCRVLRSRQGLKPGGNFPAYLATIATNLWRDKHRSARRAGPLADDRLFALDAAVPGDAGETVVLADILPDLDAMRYQREALLALDIDKALERLTPQLREVLVARYIAGESCAEIGRQYGRTEQTISSWVRAGVRQMQEYFAEETEPSVAKEQP